MQNKSVTLEYQLKKKTKSAEKDVMNNKLIKLPALLPQKIWVKPKICLEESYDKYNAKLNQ